MQWHLMLHWAQGFSSLMFHSRTVPLGWFTSGRPKPGHSRAQLATSQQSVQLLPLAADDNDYRVVRGCGMVLRLF